MSSPVTISTVGWKWIDFGEGNGADVSVGDLIAVVIQDNASSSNTVRVERCVGQGVAISVPYPLYDNGSGWLHGTSLRDSLFCAVEFDDGSVMPMLKGVGYDTQTPITYASDDSPDERGLKFQLPFPFRVAGFWGVFDLDNAADIKLYVSNDSVLETVSLDPDIKGSSVLGMWHVPFAGDYALLANTDYRLTMLSASTGGHILSEINVLSASDLDLWPMGSSFHHTSRTDGGSWTDSTVIRPMMGILVDQFDDGAVVSGQFALSGRYRAFPP